MSKEISLSQSKPHYEILDGLRGVAAVVVVFFHVLEIFSQGDHTKQLINHGYLAVDFFFLLSGYVISYAYDDRWGKMSLKDFFKRRIIRLQPMIVVGSVLGAALYYTQYSPALGWGAIQDTPVWKLLLVMLIGCTLIPVGKGLDIRGWSEMHPLNGPAWSLFYEYIANIVYALFLRRTSKTVLTILVIIAAGVTLQYAFTNANGDLIGGWSLTPKEIRVGFTRLAFPFLAGMLLARCAKIRYTKYAFLTTGILLVALLCVPRLGGTDASWMNALYECFCLMILFPLIIWIGAGGKMESKTGAKVCKFLGDISYPLYITHFPFVYTYTAWVGNNGYTLDQAWQMGLLTALISIVAAYLLMRFYDIPVREWLRKKFL